MGTLFSVVHPSVLAYLTTALMGQDFDSNPINSLFIHKNFRPIKIKVSKINTLLRPGQKTIIFIETVVTYLHS